MPNYLIYGANGFTGALIAREAVKRGHRPILAGRNPESTRALATDLGLEWRSFSLDDPGALDGGIRGVAAVLHCAGPFSHTADAMALVCIRNRCHYLDITGEIQVFESMAARTSAAKQAGIMLMPGVGFDVVPSDCLAGHLKRRLPTATHLSLGFLSLGRVSRGTAATMSENIHRGGMVRNGGRLTRVPAAWQTRLIDFGSGPVKAMSIPWGDVATAYYSTGIPNIEVYMACPLGMRVSARLSRYLGWALGSAPIQRQIKKRIQAGPPGPTQEQRERGKSLLWGEALNDQGTRVISRLEGPEGYTLTVLTALAIVDKVMAGQAPSGFQTPALAYGPDLIMEIPGIRRDDVT